MPYAPRNVTPFRFNGSRAPIGANEARLLLEIERGVDWRDVVGQIQQIVGERRRVRVPSIVGADTRLGVIVPERSVEQLLAAKLGARVARDSSVTTGRVPSLLALAALTMRSASRRPLQLHI